jgi:hypothetical protein
MMAKTMTRMKTPETTRTEPSQAPQCREETEQLTDRALRYRA